MKNATRTRIHFDTATATTMDFGMRESTSVSNCIALDDAACQILQRGLPGGTHRTSQVQVSRQLKCH